MDTYHVSVSDGDRSIEEVLVIDAVIQRFCVPGYGIENLLSDPGFTYLYLAFGKHTIILEKIMTDETPIQETRS